LFRGFDFALASPADFSAGAGFGFRVLRGSGEMMFVLMASPAFYLYYQVEPPFLRPPVFVPFAIEAKIRDRR
jgi:hypothetical protein